MNYYYCSSCDEKVKFDYKKSHFIKSHMNKEGTEINNYTIMQPKLCEINNILINHVINYNIRFVFYKSSCKWKLEFDNVTSIDVKSKLIYIIPVLSHNMEEHLKYEIKYFRKQGLGLSHISEKNITFITSVNHMTNKHHLEQTIPLAEKLTEKKLYKHYELIKSLNDIDLT